MKNPENLEKELLRQSLADKIDKIVVGAVLLNDNSEVLLVQRAESENFLPNVWEFPSGHVEKKEGLIEGLKREIQEETGFTDIIIIGYLDHFDYSSKSGKSVRQFNFVILNPACQVVQLNPSEHQSFKFCNADEAQALGADNNVLGRYSNLATFLSQNSHIHKYFQDQKVKKANKELTMN